MIKVVLFDIDGVLVDSRAANVAFISGLITKSGYKKPTRRAVLETFHMTLLQSIQYLTKSNSPAEVKKIWRMAYASKYPTHLFKMPRGVIAAVNKLSRRYILGIVTSRIKIGELALFRAFPEFRKYFKVVVTFEHTTKHKPHPAPLILAAKKLKIRPSQAVYIGDGRSDVLAARACKMKSIIYSKERISGADAYLKSFRALPKTVNGLDKV